MVMAKQEMEMGMETIANGNVKENHGFIHDFPWNFNPCKFLKMCIKLPVETCSNSVIIILDITFS